MSAENLKLNDSVTAYRIKFVLAIMTIIFLVVHIMPVIVILIKAIRRGFHNIREGDDILFDEIDKYIHRWGDCNENYLRQVHIIKWYYRKGGPVDQLVKEQKIERLFRRLDFLQTRRNSFPDTVNLLYSLVISVIAAFVVSCLEESNTNIGAAKMIVIGCILFGFLLLKYSQRGQLGSYTQLVDSYEIDLLKNKIKKLEFGIKVLEEDERILHTQQIVIDALIKRRQKEIWKKERIVEDIETVQKLKLCLEDYSDCYFRKILIGEEEAVLLYDKETGRKKYYVDSETLKTREYRILFSIIEKYKLFKYA